MRQNTGRLIGVVVTAALGILGPMPSWAAGELAVDEGMTVSLEYTLTLPDRTKVESNVGQQPIVFTQGSGHLVPGLEKALIGMKAGQIKHIEVPAELGYGVYNADAQIKVPRNKVPPTVKVGDELASPPKYPYKIRVLEVTNQHVVLDTNHPLAGKDLIFDVKILKVERASGKP